MIDFFRVELPSGALDSCPAITLPSSVDVQTGEECSPWREAEYEGLKVRVHNGGRTLLEGSLHQYWSRGHNGGEFPAWAVGEAVRQLSQALGFDPSQALLQTVEFGVNVPLQAPAKELLQRAVLHKTDPLDLKTYGGKGYFREATKQRYYFKLYDKALQLQDLGFSDPGPLLRVEVKARKMKYLEAAGVATLADLTKPAALLEMGRLLTRNLEQVLFAGPLPLPATLSTPERRLLTVGSTLRYWEGLTPTSLRRIKSDYRAVYAHHVADPALQSAAQALETVWQQLLTQPEPGAHSATAVPQINPSVRVLPRPLPPQNERAAAALIRQPDYRKEEGGGEGEGGGMRVSKQAPARCCHTCGLPINVKSGRKFCSPKERGSAAAKRCRNADSNLRNNKARALRKVVSEPVLFDQRPFVRVPEHVREFVLTAAAA